jgi:signal transduction histidine kinase
MRHVKFPIQKKLILAVFATSAVVTGIFILGTFLYDYVKENNELETQIEYVETNNLEPLTKLLWDYNEQQLSTQVESISHLPQVVRVELENLDNSQVIAYSNPKAMSNPEKNYLKSYDLKYKDKHDPIGRLKIEYNRQHIYEKLYDKALFIIFSQILKSLVITSILLYLFKIMVSQRLIQISGFISDLKSNNFEFIDKEKYFSDKHFKAPVYSDEISQISKILILMAYKTRRLNRLNKKEIEKTRIDLEKQKEVNVHVGKLAAIGEMASGVAHEINNPLSVAQSRTEILKRGRDVVPAEQRAGFDKSIEVLEKMIGRMTVITKSLLKTSRSDTLESLGHVDFQDILQDVLILVSDKAKVKNVKIISTNDRFPLYCRHVEISQILTNLINNSIDALESNEEKWIKIVIEKEIVAEQEFALIKVIDSGSGIPEHIQEKLMQPFFTTKPVGKGVGIGLSISKKIAAEHNGSLTLNTKSINTCFELRLPLGNSKYITLVA